MITALRGYMTGVKQKTATTVKSPNGALRRRKPFSKRSVGAILKSAYGLYCRDRITRLAVKESLG